MSHLQDEEVRFGTDMVPDHENDTFYLEDKNTLLQEVGTSERYINVCVCKRCVQTYIHV